MLSFRPLSWADLKTYSQLYKLCPVHASEYSFFALWGWNGTQPVELAFSDGLVWPALSGSPRRVLAPVGPWAEADWNGIFARHFAPKDRLHHVPKELLSHFPKTLRERFSLAPERDLWEYIHPVRELIELRGSVYASKRSHMRAFIAEHNPEYLPLLPDDFPELLAFQELWRKSRGPEDETARALDEEELAIRRALDRWEDFPLTGALLRVQGKTIAYTIAEELDPETLDIRFEKALGNLSGSYQALNCLFLEHQGSGYAWVNREDDAGDPGLRAAKLSYNPKRMIEKYRLELLS